MCDTTNDKNAYAAWFSGRGFCVSKPPHTFSSYVWLKGRPSQGVVPQMAEEDEPYTIPAVRTTPNLLQRRGTFETITQVFAGAEQTLGGNKLGSSG